MCSVHVYICALLGVWPNGYIWLCTGKNALFTHTILIETCSKLNNCCNVKCVDHRLITIHEKHACSGDDFQYTYLQCT